MVPSNASRNMTMAVGTFLWVAPEVLQQLPYDCKADVYGFGIVMWEIAVREVGVHLADPGAADATLLPNPPDWAKVTRCPLPFLRIGLTDPLSSPLPPNATRYSLHGRNWRSSQASKRLSLPDSARPSTMSKFHPHFVKSCSLLGPATRGNDPLVPISLRCWRPKTAMYRLDVCSLACSVISALMSDLRWYVWKKLHATGAAILWRCIGNCGR